jgi:RNA polymerase sigma factor (sigma-70 family)
MSKITPAGQKRKPFMVAVVLGATLAAFGAAESASASELSDKALGGIDRYCSACWRNARLPIDRWGDCTQEVFTRLLERVPISGWKYLLEAEGEARREFMRAIDTVKKRHQRERARSAGLSEPVSDVTDSQARRASEDREVLWRAASRLLSARQRHILRLTCEGYTVADIAAQLGMTPERVSDEKYKAIQKLRAHFETAAEAVA